MIGRRVTTLPIIEAPANGQPPDDAEARAARVRRVTVDDLPMLLDPTDHAMALMFERFYASCLHTSPQYGAKSWSGHVWQDDGIQGRLGALAIETVQTLMAAADTIPIPSSTLTARLDALRAERRRGDPAATLDDVEHHIRGVMRAKLKKWESAGRLNAMVEMASARKPLLVDISEFDRDPMAFPVANGVLDLSTATLRPARPEDKLTKAVAITYDKEATCPRFERFLTEIFPTETDDLVGFMQRLIGMCLTGVVKDHILPILWGDGSNGKTTLLKVLRALLGPFAQVAPMSLLMESKHGRAGIPNDVARLVGMRLAVTEETPERGRLAEETIKALTGGSPLTGRFLHHEFFDFDPTHKVMLITNNKPVIRGQDYAIWRRVALVPFTVKFWKPGDRPPAGANLADLDLPAELLSELPGILAWAVRGCLAWQTDGLRLPTIVQAATAEYRAEQDILGPFIEEHCDVNPAAWVAFEDLYAKYETWATAQRDRVASKQALGRLLTERGFSIVKIGGAKGRKGLCLRSGSFA